MLDQWAGPLVPLRGHALQSAGDFGHAYRTEVQAAASQGVRQATHHGRILAIQALPELTEADSRVAEEGLDEPAELGPIAPSQGGPKLGDPSGIQSGGPRAGRPRGLPPPPGPPPPPPPPPPSPRHPSP